MVVGDHQVTEEIFDFICGTGQPRVVHVPARVLVQKVRCLEDETGGDVRSSPNEPVDLGVHVSFLCGGGEEKEVGRMRYLTPAGVGLHLHLAYELAPSSQASTVFLDVHFLHPRLIERLVH